MGTLDVLSAHPCSFFFQMQTRIIVFAVALAVLAGAEPCPKETELVQRICWPNIPKETIFSHLDAWEVQCFEALDILKECLSLDSRAKHAEDRFNEFAASRHQSFGSAASERRRGQADAFPDLRDLNA
jgi:hypothetical protein